MVVEPTLGERARRSLGNFQVLTSKQVGDGPVVDAPELDDKTRMPRAAPFDLTLCTLKQHACTRLEPVGEVCQGNHLDSAVDSIRAGDLADADHPRVPPFRGPRDRGSCRVSGALARSTKTRLRSLSEATRTNVRMASMLRPALPMNRPTSPSASLTLIAMVPPPRSNDSTRTSSGFSASDLATYSMRAL